MGLLLGTGVPALAESAPDLRSAASFVVLANSAVTNSGTTRVAGNVGVSPGKVISGLSREAFSVGDPHRDDALARQARVDAHAADDELARKPCSDHPDSPILGGKTLRPGVHCFDSADVKLDGALILDAEGDRDAVWILRIAGKLTTASDASVLVVGNGYDGNVFWTAGAAVLGARTVFIGNLFARTDVALDPGARLSGRLFARTGTVALNANDVSLCCAPIALAPAFLPGGTVGTPYRETITANGGLAPYTYAVTSGTLPAGVALASNGVLEGTPSILGLFAFTITATDARGCSGTAAYGIRIVCGARIPLPIATLGIDYAASLASEGTCALSDGELPRGLSLEGCILTGKPDTAGTFAFAVDNIDALGMRRSRCYTVDVVPCPIHFVPPPPPPGTLCAPYDHFFKAGGGVEPYTFTAPPASLPPGLRLDPDGHLIGTPSAPGHYPVPVTATDALLRSCTTTHTIEVACPDSPGDPIGLADGIVMKDYRTILPAPACGGPWIFSFVSGELPPGLTPPLPDGTISGTPTKDGTYRFVVARTGGACVVTHAVTITIGDPGAIAGIPALSARALCLVSVLLAIAGWIAIGRR